jgi:membrane associated rhomboid family serine protease
MNIPSPENRFRPFIRKMTRILLILAGTAACVADFLNVFVLERPPVASGALFSVIGLLCLSDEIEKPREGRSRLLLITSVVVAAGGAVLQIFSFISRLP